METKCCCSHSLYILQSEKQSDMKVVCPSHDDLKHRKGNLNLSQKQVSACYAVLCCAMLCYAMPCHAYMAITTVAINPRLPAMHHAQSFHLLDPIGYVTNLSVRLTIHLSRGE